MRFYLIIYTINNYIEYRLCTIIRYLVRIILNALLNALIIFRIDFVFGYTLESISTKISAVKFIASSARITDVRARTSNNATDSKGYNRIRNRQLPYALISYL